MLWTAVGIEAMVADVAPGVACTVSLDVRACRVSVMLFAPWWHRRAWRRRTLARVTERLAVECPIGSAFRVGFAGQEATVSLRFP